MFGKINIETVRTQNTEKHQFNKRSDQTLTTACLITSYFSKLFILLLN